MNYLLWIRVEKKIKTNAIAERQLITDAESLKEKIRNAEVNHITNVLTPSMTSRHAMEVKIAQKEAALAEEMLKQKLTEGQEEVTNLKTLMILLNFMMNLLILHISIEWYRPHG